MKYVPATLRDNPRIAIDSSTNPADDEAWIEGLPEIVERPWAAGRPGGGTRRIGIVAVAMAGIVGLGLIGHWTSQASPPGDTRPTARSTGDPTRPDDIGMSAAGPVAITLSSPTDGAAIAGNAVDVRGLAREAAGQVHISVALGGAVLGWANVQLDAGPFEAVVPVFAPSFPVPVTLRIDQASGGRVSLARSIVLSARRSVELWGVERLTGSEPPVLIVDGFGPLTSDRVRMTVRMEGVTIAFATAEVAVENLRPGSAGGRMLGLGSFHVRLVLPAAARSAPVSLGLVWRDTASGPPFDDSRLITTVAASVRP